MGKDIDLICLWKCKQCVKSFENYFLADLIMGFTRIIEIPKLLFKAVLLVFLKAIISIHFSVNYVTGKFCLSITCYKHLKIASGKFEFTQNC